VVLTCPADGANATAGLSEAGPPQPASSSGNKNSHGKAWFLDVFMGVSKYRVQAGSTSQGVCPENSSTRPWALRDTPTNWAVLWAVLVSLLALTLLSSERKTATSVVSRFRVTVA
jgi:hypothetical protein